MSLFTPDPELLKQQPPDEDDKKKDSKPDKPKRERKPTKAEIFTAQDCTDKLHRLWTAYYNVTMSTRPKRPLKDFEADGESLARIADQYDIVRKVLKSLDPLFLALGSYNKFAELTVDWIRKSKEKREAKKLAKQQQGNGIMVIDQPPQQPHVQ